MAPPKQKGQKMGLGEFLTNKSLGSWADEMEDMPMPSGGGGGGGMGGGSSFGGDSAFGARRDYGASSGGYGGGYGERESFPVRESLPVPDKPPYTAHVGNLSFDVTDGEIGDFFATCSVANVRLVRDRMEDRPKGFGYVEFATKEGLLAALDMNGAQLSGRSVRISVAEPPKEGTFVMPVGNWDRRGPLAPLDPPARTGRSGFGDRGDRDMGDRRQSSYGADDGKVRDFNNWERKGPLSPATSERPRSGDREFRRRASPTPSAGGREFRERPAFERAPSAADADSAWRKSARPDQPQRSGPSSPVLAQVRPKLELKKRSEAPPVAGDTPTTATPGTDKPNPFGTARPIDTFQREREIEERRTAAAAAKKEREEKERERRRAEREKGGSDAGTPTGPGKSFDMLRRGSGGTAAGSETAETPASEEPSIKERTAPGSGTVSPTTAAPPAKEEEVKKPVVHDSWRRAPPKDQASAAGPPGTPKEEVDGDGWATVKASKRGRGANGKASISSTS